MTAASERTGPEGGSRARAFWSDPPWRGGRTPFRMGLRRIDVAGWLADAASTEDRARKAALMAQRGSEVVDAVPGFENHQRLVALAMAEELRQRPAFAALVPAAPQSLAEIALWVPDDLCLLVPSPAGYRLVAASLCAPSFWRLQEKLGHSIHGVHGPVQGLNAAVGDYVARFFERLNVGEIFQRRNWNLHRSYRRFHPAHEDWSAPLTEGDCATLCMRSETQTLRKYSNGALLFSIRVDRFALGEIAAHPQALEDLLSAVAAMSPDERRASVIARHGDTLVRYLQGRLATV